MSADSFIPLRSVELDILLSVAEEAKHGYAIHRDARDRAGRHPGFEIPTLYRALRRMRDLGLVRMLERTDETDARRQFWQATALGREVLEAEVARLTDVVAEGKSAIRRLAEGSR